MVIYDCPMLTQAPQIAYSEESTFLSAIGTRSLAEPKQREGKVSSTEISALHLENFTRCAMNVNRDRKLSTVPVTV
jgi:hypothetical protein